MDVPPGLLAADDLAQFDPPEAEFRIPYGDDPLHYRRVGNPGEAGRERSSTPGALPMPSGRWHRGMTSTSMTDPRPSASRRC